MTQRSVPEVSPASKPRVSVGLPVYNGESTISRAIESVLAQTYTDFELIISDNCSTDGTEELARTYARQDDRVVYRRPERNIGLVKNFDRLPHLARGEFFKWIACDDFIHEDFIKRCLEVAEQDDEIITVAPTLNIVRPDGEVIYPLSAYVHHGAWSEDRLTQHSQMMDEVAYCERYGGALFLAYVYGFHRRNLLLRTRLLLPFIWSDSVLAGELSLWGRLLKLDEALNNFTSSESEASTTANIVNWNPENIQRILDPTRHGRRHVAWSQRARHFEHVRGAARAPVGPLGKLRASTAATRPFREAQKDKFVRLRRRWSAERSAPSPAKEP
jgi:glycosyltransferase involved in cell wall biosynthesis